MKIQHKHKQQTKQEEKNKNQREIKQATALLWWRRLKDQTLNVPENTFSSL